MPTPTTTIFLRGKLLDAQNGHPLPAVLVKAELPGSATGQATEIGSAFSSKADGAFSIFWALDEKQAQETTVAVVFSVFTGADTPALRETRNIRLEENELQALRVPLPKDDEQEVFRLYGKLQNAPTGAPVAYAELRAIVAYNPKQLKRQAPPVYSDGVGRFSLDYALPKSAKGKAIVVTLQVIHNGQTVQEKLRIKAGDTEEKNVGLEITGPMLVSITDLKTLVNIPARLKEYLDNKKVQTLQDIAYLGGLAAQRDLPETPDVREAVQLLDAHAQLGVLQTAPQLNDQLIRAGFDSVQAITNVDRLEFIQRVGAAVDRMELDRVYARGTTIKGLIAGKLIDRIQQLRTPWVFGDDNTTDGHALNCHCEDCKAMVSPLAYLADLLNYTVKYVKEESVSPGTQPVWKSIDLEYLQTKFFQPFKDLPASCEAQEERLCQQRIATEVLYAYTKSLDSSNVNQKEIDKGIKDYWIETYHLLLRQIGTNYDEIRRIYYEKDPVVRQRLADRLGIDVSHLNDLFIDVKTFPATGGEAKLESLFGYRDTKRDPLTATPQGLLEKWRREYLRVLWTNSDGMNDAYARKELPVVDPDIIGIDDMRNPDPVNINTTYGVWRKRTLRITKWVNDWFRAKKRHWGIDIKQTVLFIPGIDLSLELNPQAQIQVVVTDANNTQTVKSAVVTEIRAFRNGTLLKLDAGVVTSGTEKITGIQLDKRRDIVFDSNGPKVFIVYEDLTAEIQVAPNVEIFNGNTSLGAFQTGVDFTLQFDFAGRNTVLDLTGKNLSAATSILYKQRLEVGVEVLDLAAVFGVLSSTPFPYGTSNNIIWTGNAKTTEILPLRNKISQGVDVEKNLQALKSDFKLERDAFFRLAELYEKWLACFIHPEKEPLTAEEEEEVLSILIQSVKDDLRAEWIKEEISASDPVTLNYEDLWISLREPKAGFLPFSLPPAGVPFIDPELLTLKDLPENVPYAINWWVARKQELADLIETFGAKLQNDGFIGLLELALNQGNPIHGDTEVYWSAITADLNSADQKRITWAKKEIGTALLLSLEDFLFITEMKAKEADTPGASPADTLLNVYRILATANKKKFLYPNWRNIEDDATNPGKTPPLPVLSVSPWFAWKTSIPKWRASSAARIAWQEALKARLETPMIDPDIVEPADFVQPTSGPVFNLYTARHDWVKTEIDALKALNPSLDAMINATLGITVEEMTALRDMEAMGESIKGRLFQLNLDFTRFRFLLNIIAIWDNNPADITDGEWQEVYELLVQVKKERQYAFWHQEEKAQGVTLSQDYFVLPEKSLSSFPLNPEDGKSAWLYSWRKRRDWTRKLEGRVEQEETVVSGIEASIEATEDVTLKILRDAYIRAVSKPGESFGAASKRLSETLLIDMQQNCCQKTTRVSQAIESLQVLLWSLRTHQVEDEYHDLVLARIPYDFDEEWKWLGTYASWRAAIFVFVYPQNLLIPTLRRRQTPGFLKLVESVSRNKRFTPRDACHAAHEYAVYYKDVANLEVGATAETEARIHEGICNPTGQEKAVLFFKFARSPITNTAYWSATWPDDIIRDTFWEKIPELEDNVLQIFGACVYRYFEDQYLYVFYKTMKDEKRPLSFVRLHLETLSWESPVELEMPRDGKDFQAVVKQNYFEDQAPQLVIQYDQHGCFFRNLNEKGDEWAEETFEYMSLDWYFIKAWVSVNKEESVLVAQGFGGDTKVYYQVLSADHGDGGWMYPDIAGDNYDGLRNFVGAWFGPVGKGRVYVFYKQDPAGTVDYFILDRSTAVLPSNVKVAKPEFRQPVYDLILSSI